MREGPRCARSVAPSAATAQIGAGRGRDVVCVTGSELASAIANETRLPPGEAAAALQAALRRIQAALARGEAVQLLGFGTFEVQARSAPGGHGPWTGRVPAFRPGASLRRAVRP